ncbi:MAG: Inner membrane protein YbiR [Lentisphaerae bacterium ADurb.BinA184]|nr:MAG: Inner membrane protein YbiR [Lentisphaerae bacterium ADurb.BinA184]
MPGVDPKIPVVLVFLVAYGLVIRYDRWKMAVVWGAAGVLLATGLLSPLQAWEAIEWDVVLLYYGMLLVSEAFLHSRMPDYLAVKVASRCHGVRMAMVALCVFTGFLSVFLENVAVVLLMAPVGLAISRKCEIPPGPLFVGMAVSSNLQGCATMIGDPPSMLLAGHAHLSFNEFFVLDGRPSIFFAVQVGMLASAAVLFFQFRPYSRRMPELKPEPYLSVVPTLLVIGLVMALAVASSSSLAIPHLIGLVCCAFGGLSFLWHLHYFKERNVPRFLARLDWQTGLFLIGIFVLVKSLIVVGLMEDIAEAIPRLAGGSRLGVFVLIVGISVVVSAFVDNVPFLVAMLPVVQLVAQRSGLNPYLFYFGLLIGASVGGNITPIGASANIVACGILKRDGHPVSFAGFFRIGLPFTLAATAASCLVIWLVFGRA